MAVLAAPLGAAPADALPAPSAGEPLPLTSQAHARPAAGARAGAADATPLTVEIESLSPSYVPRKGPVRMSGSVTN
ncbi:MAG: hypothetical protein JWO76_1504, partial [Nocardioides sp.]|nr:hypothetical protein [Nocardioides sp.]